MEEGKIGSEYERWKMSKMEEEKKERRGEGDNEQGKEERKGREGGRKKRLGKKEERKAERRGGEVERGGGNREDGSDASDEPLIIEAEVEGYLVRRVYVDEGSSVEVMFEHCFENLPAKVRAGLRETRTTCVGLRRRLPGRDWWRKPLGKIDLEVCFGNEDQGWNESSDAISIDYLLSISWFPTPEKEIATLGQPDEGADLTKQILVNPCFLDQIITIGGRLSPVCKNQLKTLPNYEMEVWGFKDQVLFLVAPTKGTIKFMDLAREAEEKQPSNMSKGLLLHEDAITGIRDMMSGGYLTGADYSALTQLPNLRLLTSDCLACCWMGRKMSSFFLWQNVSKTDLHLDGSTLSSLWHPPCHGRGLPFHLAVLSCGVSVASPSLFLPCTSRCLTIDYRVAHRIFPNNGFRLLAGRCPPSAVLVSLSRWALTPVAGPSFLLLWRSVDSDHGVTLWWRSGGGSALTPFLSLCLEWSPVPQLDLPLVLVLAICSWGFRVAINFLVTINQRVQGMYRSVWLVKGGDFIESNEGRDLHGPPVHPGVCYGRGLWGGAVPDLVGGFYWCGGGFDSIGRSRYLALSR
ncbi:hypothetical protein Tco_0331324 [Tanacetum coccineum]